MTDGDFEALVAEGITALRPDIQKKLKNVAIVIDDEPSTEQLEDNGEVQASTLFGLYEGVPLTERGIDAPLFPDKITIFKKPILNAYSNIEEIKACVANTIWHEVAHHFGLDEEAVAYEEERRGKTL